jgi:hypothetical protein
LKLYLITFRQRESTLIVINGKVSCVITNNFCGLSARTIWNRVKELGLLSWRKCLF